MPRNYHKKVSLGVHERRTKWAPVWAVMKAYGKGKKKHPSELTAIRRSWRRSKLKLKPRRSHKRQLG